MAKKKLVKSAASRMFRLGGLAGRVGASMAGNTLANLFRDPDGKELQQSVAFLKNAMRVKDALGELKGVPMKIGQMLSLHEKLLPPEVARVLQSLQQKAPEAPFDEIREVIRDELGKKFKKIAQIDPTSLASASIGQVHRAVLTDGREIVLKVQYPGIDEVIRADLKNMKGVLKAVFSMITRVEIDEIWQEMSARLQEELDYENEARNMKRMAGFLKDEGRVIIPGVVEELTTRHVLAMDLVTGISPDEATGGGYSQELRSQWGVSIFTFILRNLFEFKFLHADPNLSNFAFCEDGGIVVYDFGCMKEIPEDLCHGYAKLVKAVLEHNYSVIPDILKTMGVHKADGSPVPWKMIKDYADLLQDIIDPENAYTFGEDGDIYSKIVGLGQKHIEEFMTMLFPKDIVFIDRTFNGHFGNLCRLKARADWRALITERLSSQYPHENIVY